jgi:hypothetical protein
MNLQTYYLFLQKQLLPNSHHLFDETGMKRNRKTFLSKLVFKLTIWYDIP